MITSLVLMRVTLRRPLLWGMVGCAVYSAQMIALGTTTTTAAGGPGPVGPPTGGTGALGVAAGLRERRRADLAL